MTTFTPKYICDQCREVFALKEDYDNHLLNKKTNKKISKPISKQVQPIERLTELTVSPLISYNYDAFFPPRKCKQAHSTS